MAGRDKLQEMHSKRPHENVRGLILVIDSSDVNHMDAVLLILRNMLQNNTLNNAPLLIFANKQDIPSSLPVHELVKLLELNECELLKKRPWHIQGICALSGEGLLEGFDWLSNQ
ncbi:Arf and/or G-alpha domain containing protein, partial [Asbolus verrucosus]